MKLHEFRALTFDCYGTLIDWEQGILDVLRPWSQSAGLKLNDEALLRAYAEAEPAAEAKQPDAIYPDILRALHHTLCELWGVPHRDAEADALAGSVGRWPPFPDTARALQRLKQRCKLIVVSNVDRVSFGRTATRLGVQFDAVVTAQDVGAYKPDPRMLQAGLDAAAALGADKHHTLHVAQSLYHDHVPAKALGMATCWIDRRAGRPGGATKPPAQNVTPDYTFQTLAQLADAIEQSAGA